MNDRPPFAPHLAMAPEIRARFVALRERLLDITKGRRVHYVPNPGNLGDGLIRHATLRFLDDAGIRHTEHPGGFAPSWARHCSEDVLIYGGGGAWCRFWSHSLDVLKAAAPLFHHVVVLPSTFELAADAPNATLFARDRCESLVNQPRAAFCDDMAFYLGPFASARGTGPGNFFRTDKESARRFELPSDNLDISTAGTHLDDPHEAIRALAPYRVVRTDRLHVAILGALMGKRVHLHGGAYFKNRAVFESSLAGTFERVRFLEGRRTPRAPG